MSGFHSSSSNNRLLQEILTQLVRNDEHQADVNERIQQQLAMINEGDNLEIGERHYDDE